MFKKINTRLGKDRITIDYDINSLSLEELQRVCDSNKHILTELKNLHKFYLQNKELVLSMNYSLSLLNKIPLLKSTTGDKNDKKNC